MKLHFRKIQDKDLETIMNWRMREDITKYMNTDPVLTIEGQREWLNRIEQDTSTYHWIIEVDSIPIGVLNIMDIDLINKKCSWGYYIAERRLRSLKLAMAIEWNLYDYVFDTLGLNKLMNEVISFNKEVVAIHKMCGSEVIGVLKQHVWKRNTFYDVVLIEIYKDKWNEIKTKCDYLKADFE